MTCFVNCYLLNINFTTPQSGSRSKHIDIKYLAIREHVKEKKVVIEHISTELMIVDPLTKGMPPMKFKDHVDRMEIVSSL